ncbi:MAG: peroxiredoxin [Alphaproteobacteria bacterium]|tara:strand:- start:51 stop:533 length:483 start_codon:yes stop_codon:yes gene_type:complete
MNIKENNTFPETTFFKLTDKGPTPFKSLDLFSGKKVILVGVPGAFTPTCSEEHLPGYMSLLEEFKSKGIDKIYFISTNDPFVMKAWGNSVSKTDYVEFLSDGNGEFRDISGLEFDLSSVGLGKRYSRFAIYIDNGQILKIFNEGNPGLDLSKAENVLRSI